MNEILILVAGGIIGVMGHCIMKAQSLKKDAKAANLPWKFMDYVNEDYLGIALSFVSVAIWLIIVPEAVLKYPKIQEWLRASFVGMGLLGSYLIQTVTSVAKKRIRNEVDHATNELDKIKSLEDGKGQG